MRRTDHKTVRSILKREPVHPFPARMAPGLAWEALKDGQSAKPLRVLDPMSGSGTVLAVARSMGHRAIGNDVDPLAVLISRVWTTSIDLQQTGAAADKVLANARSIFKSLPKRNAYPKDADDETRKFTRYWFDDYARRQLAALATAISEVEDETVRNVLWCAFSRLIISKQSGASRAMDLSHSRPHRVFARAPAKPFRKFLSAVGYVAKNCIHNGDDSGPPAKVYEGDARHLPLQDGSIDLVITSPPYLNAIDYLRCSKFSLVWMGYPIHELRGIRSESIGTEKGPDAEDNQQTVLDILSRLKLRPELEKRYEAILLRYIDDIRRTVKETARVLVDGGKAVYVVGDNTIRDTFIRNSLIAEYAADAVGLVCKPKRSRTLPANRRYLPPPSTQENSAALGGRMRREVILTFQKAA